MPLVHKRFHNGLEMELYYPGTEPRTPFKRAAITVLADAPLDALRASGLMRLADDQELILCAPLPPKGTWTPEDAPLFTTFQDGMTRPDDEPLPVDSVGIPTLEAMSASWHPMNDVKYLIGVGSGASLALLLAARQPENIAAVWALGGALPPQTSALAPMPVWLTNADAATAACFRAANQADVVERGAAFSRVHPLQRVVTDDGAFDEPHMRQVWNGLFSRARRTNAGAHGEVEPRMGDARRLFECFIEDERLGGRHTWFTHVPASANTGARLPLVLFFHGGSDNPAEAAEMCKLHELGEREGFVTVYPWATNRCAWNTAMDPALPDDVAFSAALIRYMLRNYPVDAERVYLSGFSNGAAQAQCVALAHPGLIAGIFPIDGNWPGVRGRYRHVEDDEVAAFQAGLARKAEYDYRMPVWYTYGSREPSCPVYRDSTQQNQYDFWKRYNHIEVRPTPRVGEPNPTGCGVTGDRSETLFPSARHPEHRYDAQRFWTRDPEPFNCYNYVLMRDKGHEVAEMDAALGWEYVKRFRRLPDGALVYRDE